MSGKITQMAFANRQQAGRMLAERLSFYRRRRDVVVLGLARGGVPVAFEVAKALGAPLDVFILRKLGVPGHEELAFGAIATGGVHVLDEQIIDAVGLSAGQMQRVIAVAQEEMDRRERLYRKDRAAQEVKGKTAILIDDGIATGSSIRAAIAALRKLEAARIVIAVPVAPRITCSRLEKEADEVVCLHAPEAFYAVGAFYHDFSQVSDAEVEDLLRQASLTTGGAVDVA